MERNQMTLQDLIRQNGPLSTLLATNYINQIASELEHMHSHRRICHLDVRPDMITLHADGKVSLKDSSLCQSYSEEGAATDFRDLKAVNHYLLTGKKAKAESKPHPQAFDRRQTSKDPETSAPKGNPYMRKLLTTLGIVFLLCMAGYFISQKFASKTEIVNRTYADYHYKGEWKDGKPHGKGTANYFDGRRYEGKFVKGERSDKHARFVYSNGNVFEGAFAADTIQEGKVTLKSGEYYFVGKFSQGKPYSGYWYRSTDQQRVEQVVNGKEVLL